MSSLTERIRTLENDLLGVKTRQIGVTGSAIVYAALGAYAMYGCRVTEGGDPDSMAVALEGLADGDSDHHNPDAAETPQRPFQYPNIASLADGGFYAPDLAALVESPPATGLARYDIAYIFLGQAGAGFAIA